MKPQPIPNSRAAVWQCVLVCWGTKFSAGDLLGLISQIRGHSSVAPQIVLLTDRLRDDMPDDVIQRLIPEFYLQKRFMSGGAQAKLGQFAKGVLPDDIPTVYVDIDTLVVGDLYRLVAALTDTSRLLMLPNSSLVFSRLARCVASLTSGRFKTRGNSSLLCYLPSECHHIDSVFRAQFADGATVPAKALVADDKFMSWIDHARTRRISNRIAVKFPVEYMGRVGWRLRLRASLPWIKKRRSQLCAITFPGKSADIGVLLNLSEGEILRDHRNRHLVWNDASTFPVKQILDNGADQG